MTGYSIGLISLACSECGEFLSLMLEDGRKRYIESCRSCYTPIKVLYNPDTGAITVEAMPVS